MTQIAGTAPAAMPLPGGGDISKLLKSEGPVVSAVLLKAGGDMVEEIQVDTTPQKQMVQEILGGPFTFLGQYEEEGIVLMCRRGGNQGGDDLRKNEHKLQPPFDSSEVYGDILCLRVAAVEEDEDEHDVGLSNLASKSNEEFFLNYTKDEYTKFAARTDVEVPNAVVSGDTEQEEEDEMESDDDEEVEGESDEDDDNGAGFLEMLMGQVLQRFQEENGRPPNEEELHALQSAITAKLGGAM